MAVAAEGAIEIVNPATLEVVGTVAAEIGRAHV